MAAVGEWPAATGPWAVEGGGFGGGGQAAPPPLADAYPQPDPQPIPNPGPGPSHQQHKGKGKKNPPPNPPPPNPPPAPAKLTCKERRERRVRIIREGFSHLRESLHVVQTGITSMNHGLTQIEDVMIEIATDDCKDRCEKPSCPTSTLILICAMCVPNGRWVTRDDLRGATNTTPLIRYQRALEHLVHAFWPNEEGETRLDGYYLIRTIQVGGFCKQTRTKRYRLQCAISTGCPSQKTECYSTGCHQPQKPECCRPPGCHQPQKPECCRPPNCYRPPDCFMPPTRGCYPIPYYSACGRPQGSTCCGPPKCPSTLVRDVRPKPSYHDFDPKDWDEIIDKAASLHLTYNLT